MTGGLVVAAGALLALVVVSKDSLTGAICISSCTDTTRDADLLGVGLEVALAVGVVLLIGSLLARDFPRVLIVLECLGVIGIAVALALVAADSADVHFSINNRTTKTSDVSFMYLLLLPAGALFVAGALRAHRDRAVHGRRSASRSPRRTL